MADPSATDIGVVALGVLFILREVFAFLKTRNGKKSNSAGDKSPEWWIGENADYSRRACRSRFRTGRICAQAAGRSIGKLERKAE
jgi:hypothetical protein